MLRRNEVSNYRFIIYDGIQPPTTVVRFKGRANGTKHYFFIFYASYQWLQAKRNRLLPYFPPCTPCIQLCLLLDDDIAMNKQGCEIGLTKISMPLL